MRNLLLALLVLAHVASLRPAQASETPIYLYGSACIHVVVYNDAVADARSTVQRAVDWWRTQAPASQFAALITTEARRIDGLHANDPRVFDYFGSWRDSGDWRPAARAANAERQRQAGCATSWTLFITPTREQGWAHVYGPLAFVATGNDIPIEAQIAHELGHIYGALDQTRSAGVACTERSGVLSIETQNSDQPGCLLRQDSIMKNPAYSYAHGLVDRYALMQMGAWDSDGDSLVDPRDPTPFPVLRLPLVQQAPSAYPLP